MPERDISSLRAFGPGGRHVLRVVCVSARALFGVFVYVDVVLSNGHLHIYNPVHTFNPFDFPEIQMHYVCEVALRAQKVRLRFWDHKSRFGGQKSYPNRTLDFLSKT